MSLHPRRAGCRESSGSTRSGNAQQFAWLQSGRTNNPIVESRSRAGAALSDWLTGWLRWEGGAAIDRIESATYLSLNGNLNVRLFDDHMAAILGGSWYTGSTQTATGNLVVAVRSTTRDDRFVLLGRGGVAAAGDTAPLSLWPTAGSGYDQLAPLRAHPLVQSGIVASEVFGRQMAFVSAEGTYPVPTRMGPTFLGVVGFVDVARAWSGLGAPFLARCMWTSAPESGSTRRAQAERFVSTLPTGFETGKFMSRLATSSHGGGDESDITIGTACWRRHARRVCWRQHRLGVRPDSVSRVDSASKCHEPSSQPSTNSRRPSTRT